MCVTEAWIYRECGCRYDHHVPCSSSLEDVDDEYDQYQTLSYESNFLSPSSTQSKSNRTLTHPASLESQRHEKGTKKACRKEMPALHAVHMEFLEPLCDDCLLNEIGTEGDNSSSGIGSGVSREAAPILSDNNIIDGSEPSMQNKSGEGLIWESSVEISIEQAKPDVKADEAGAKVVHEVSIVDEETSRSNSTSDQSNSTNDNSNSDASRNDSTITSISDLESWYNDNESDESDADDEDSLSHLSTPCFVDPPIHIKTSTNDYLGGGSGKLRTMRSEETFLHHRRTDVESGDLRSHLGPIVSSEWLAGGEKRKQERERGMDQRYRVRSQRGVSLSSDEGATRKVRQDEETSRLLKPIPLPELDGESRTPNRGKTGVKDWAKGVVGKVGRSMGKRTLSGFSEGRRWIRKQGACQEQALEEPDLGWKRGFADTPSGSPSCLDIVRPPTTQDHVESHGDCRLYSIQTNVPSESECSAARFVARSSWEDHLREELGHHGQSDLQPPKPERHLSSHRYRYTTIPSLRHSDDVEIEIITTTIRVKTPKGGDRSNRLYLDDNDGSEKEFGDEETHTPKPYRSLFTPLLPCSHQQPNPHLSTSPADSIASCARALLESTPKSCLRIILSSSAAGEDDIDLLKVANHHHHHQDQQHLGSDENNKKKQSFRRSDNSGVGEWLAFRFGEIEDQQQQHLGQEKTTVRTSGGDGEKEMAAAPTPNIIYDGDDDDDVFS